MKEKEKEKKKILRSFKSLGLLRFLRGFGARGFVPCTVCVPGALWFCFIPFLWLTFERIFFFCRDAVARLAIPPTPPPHHVPGSMSILSANRPNGSHFE